MKQRWNKKIAAGSIALSLVLGGASALQAAYAADTSATPTPQASVQPDAKTQQHGERGFGGKHFRGKEADGFGVKLGGDWLATAATALGIEQEALKTELAGGKSLADVATEKGVAKDDLIAKLVASLQAKLDEKAANGNIAQDKLDQAKQKIADEVAKLVDQKGLADKRFEGGRGGQSFGYIGGDWLATAATALGVEQDALKTELAGGKSLADVATEKSVAKDDLIAKLVASAQAKLDEKAAKGNMTQAQIDKAKQRIADEVAKLVDRKGLAAKGPGGPGGRGGHGGKGFGGGGLPLAKDKLASILGISADDLAAELKEGKSLSDIAAEKGIAKDQLVGNIKDNLTDWIGQMVDRKHEGKAGKGKQHPAPSATPAPSAAPAQ